MTERFRTEIGEQPNALHRMLHSEAQMRLIREAAGMIRDTRPAVLLFAGRGSSDNAGVYARYLFETRNGYPVSLVAPSVYTRYNHAPHMERAVVIALSQSGQSPDIAAVMAYARTHAAGTIAITNDAESELAQAAEHVLFLDAGPETSVPSSKTFTSSLMMLNLLSEALDTDNGFREELHRLPDATASLIENEKAFLDLGKRIYGERVVVTGRGFQFAAALETALKLCEAAQTGAWGISAAELLHGPIASISGNVNSLVISGPTNAEDASEVIAKLESAGSPLGVISFGDAVRHFSAISVPDVLSAPPAAMLAAVAGQITALGAARAAGVNPDRPRTLNKVTVTL